MFASIMVDAGRFAAKQSRKWLDAVVQQCDDASMNEPPAGPLSPGQELARRFYLHAVAPLLGGVPHAAALLGNGSEVLGYDDRTSTDHDYGPRLQLFLPAGTDPAPVQLALTALPDQFDGFPVGFHRAFGATPDDGHQIEVTTVEGFFTAALGTDPASGLTLADWLLAPTQRLATLTAGAVFHDPAGALAQRRDTLSWYPDDTWRYVLAAGWLRIGQEEAFIGRTGGTGDDLGSAVVTSRVVRDLIRLAFLVERRWAPYSKWLGRAFAGLRLAVRLRPALDRALSADGWREREAGVCEAASLLGQATNQLRLAAPVDPSPRRFHERDIRVVGGERFAEALTEDITDPQVRQLLARLGTRGGGLSVGALPGAIDQAVDSVDVLTRPERCRAAAPMLGLGVT